MRDLAMTAFRGILELMTRLLINFVIAAGALLVSSNICTAEMGARNPKKAACSVKLHVLFGEHFLSVPMPYWKRPAPAGGGNGPPVPECGAKREQIQAAFATAWPDFLGNVGYVAQPHGPIKTSHPDDAWGGSLDFRIGDEKATKFGWEWPYLGDPHPDRVFSEMLDFQRENVEKWKDTTEVKVRSDPDGEIAALTFCGAGSGPMVGCTDNINHSGLRVTITFAKALLPHLEAIEAGVTRLIDNWSN